MTCYSTRTLPHKDPVERAAYHRAYNKRMYADPAWRKRHMANVAVAKKKRMAEIAWQVNELKKQPCMDCGKKFPPICMDWDHRVGSDKIKDVSGMVMRAWSADKIFAEIKKCDLVCSNCHRIRSKNRRDAARKKRKKRVKDRE